MTAFYHEHHLASAEKFERLNRPFCLSYTPEKLARLE
jgi:hypothetical protein